MPQPAAHLVKSGSLVPPRGRRDVRIRTIALAGAAVGLSFALGGCLNSTYRQAAPYCAETNGGDYGLTRDCAYFTYEQCLKTISGVGGQCVLNDAPDSLPPRHVKRRIR